MESVTFKTNDPKKQIELAPIILFCYNRVEYLIQTVMALRANELADQSDLIIFSDGPKNECDTGKVKAVREYIHLIQGFRKVEIHESPVNKGLANSVIAGVTEVVNRYGKVIVLEDDLVTSPFFLKFMNDALNKYEEEEQVVSIHGNTLEMVDTDQDTFFQRGAHCWGWATWKSGWDLLEQDAEKLLAEVNARHLQQQFDQMLIDQKNGKIDSWAIRWYASTFLQNKLTLFSGKNLVSHIGQTGTHYNIQDMPIDKLTDTPPIIKDIPIKHDEKMFYQIAETIRHKKHIGPPVYLEWLKKLIRYCCPYGILCLKNKLIHK